MGSPTQKVALEPGSSSSLPTDIIPLIVSYLPCADYLSFACVCKEWCNHVPLVYPAYQSPLLMHYMKKEHGVCRYYSPCSNKTFVVNCPVNFSGSRILYSKDGWVLLSQGCNFTFVNPVTGISHQITVRNDYHRGSFAFSSSPLSSDCVIFIIHSIESWYVTITTIKGENWNDRMTVEFKDNAEPFFMSEYSSPVFLHGQFYCLGSEGNVGVFDPNEGTWTVLGKPKKPNICFQSNFLLEAEGDLMSVFIDKLETSLHVFKLNRKNMVWEKIESLNDQALFIGSLTSISATIAPKKLCNKICLSRVIGEPNIVQADIKISENRMFFVMKRVTSLERKQEPMQKSNGGVTYYDMGSCELFNHHKSAEFTNSVWFESKNEELPS